MKLHPTFLFGGAMALSLTAWSAPGSRFTVMVFSDGSASRAGTVVVLPFAEVRARLPDVRFDHVHVRHANTATLAPFQITNFTPNVRPAQYDDLIWQHDFAAGETAVTYLVKITDAPVPPFPTRVSALYEEGARGVTARKSWPNRFPPNLDRATLHPLGGRTASGRAYRVNPNP